MYSPHPILRGCIIQCVSAKLIQKLHLWAILPGIMGHANELSQLIPNDDSQLLIDYLAPDCASLDDFCNEIIDCIAKYRKRYTIHLLGYSMGV